VQAGETLPVVVWVCWALVMFFSTEDQHCSVVLRDFTCMFCAISFASDVIHVPALPGFVHR